MRFEVDVDVEDAFDIEMTSRGTDHAALRRATPDTLGRSFPDGSQFVGHNAIMTCRMLPNQLIPARRQERSIGRDWPLRPV